MEIPWKAWAYVEG